MADFCSRCGKTLSLIDPLLEIKGSRFCEDCYPEVKREHAASSMSEKMDRKSRVAFGEDESEENLRGSIIKGRQALSVKENEFKWENPCMVPGAGLSQVQRSCFEPATIQRLIRRLRYLCAPGRLADPHFECRTTAGSSSRLSYPGTRGYRTLLVS